MRLPVEVAHMHARWHCTLALMAVHWGVQVKTLSAEVAEAEANQDLEAEQRKHFEVGCLGGAGWGGWMVHS